jgi:hypothetical protein
LNDLATLNAQHSRIVELRFFGGLTLEEWVRMFRGGAPLRVGGQPPADRQ